MSGVWGRAARRLFQSAIVLILMSFFIYAAMGLMPGDPIDLMLSMNPGMSPDDVQRLREAYGLDKPVIVRYGEWLLGALQGDFGASRTFGVPVFEVLGPALGRSLLLMTSAISLALIIALPLGILAATKPRSGLDYSVNLGAFAGLSLPTFWLGIIMIITFAVTLGVLPSGGIETYGDGGFVDRARHLVMPVLTLAIVSIATYTRFTRASMIEVLRQDFIRTARAKGLSEKRVVLGHGLRNAMLPVVTILALDFGPLFSGALIVETVFAYPGMGELIFKAIVGNDFNLAMVALMLGTAVVLLGNILADIAYGLLDPRIKAK